MTIAEVCGFNLFVLREKTPKVLLMLKFSLYPFLLLMTHKMVNYLMVNVTRVK